MMPLLFKGTNQMNPIIFTNLCIFNIQITLWKDQTLTLKIGRATRRRKFQVFRCMRQSLNQ